MTLNSDLILSLHGLVMCSAQMTILPKFNENLVKGSGNMETQNSRVKYLRRQ